MRLITWNINSLRLRLPNLQRLVSEQSPDIICLQETKVCDEDFPLDACRALGYDHIAFTGEKSYNGVAILSKLPFSAIDKRQFAGPDQCRHIAVTLADGTELHNFYIPAGGDEPDREINHKFGHKLDFIDATTVWLSQSRKKSDKVILVGDLNIAPLEHDVWSHKQLLKIVSHTPIEVEKLLKLFGSLEFVDVCREHVPPSEKLYSWWSYRNRDWEISNRGRRLDHIWVTPALKERLRASAILKHARSWDSPSDHVPVVADFH